MSVRFAWPLLIALATGSLLILGIAAGKAPAPVSGPQPVVQMATVRPADLSASFLRDAHPRHVMRFLPARITGRASPRGRGFEHKWPAFHASARFEGSDVVVAISDVGGRYRITVDAASLILTRPGTGLLHIGGLGPGAHEIRLEKLSETSGRGYFGGFFLPASGTPLPPPPDAPLIEFIGDSDTVGYGNTAPGRECTGEQQYLATDSSVAYGPITARALGADYRVIAASGIGLVRNLDGTEAGTMREFYTRALPDRPRLVPAPEQPADAIVIAIGSNDFAGPQDAAADDEARQAFEDRFAAALLDFMQARRAEAPAARIVLLAFGEYGRDLVDAHRTARDAFAADGDHADLLVLPELARTGCHWHPSLNDHLVIADRLLDLLRDTQDPQSPFGRNFAESAGFLAAFGAHLLARAHLR